jgi:hypothetical protein
MVKAVLTEKAKERVILGRMQIKKAKERVIHGEMQMKKAIKRVADRLKKKDGMELVQVAILVAIAIVIGLIFRTQIQSFVDDIFADLSSGKFR